MEKTGPLKLLIVDDSVSTRRLIKTLVTTLGPDSACEVYECVDGSETIDAYRLHQPDFVLMDIQMKTMDGITATAQLKAADPLPGSSWLRITIRLTYARQHSRLERMHRLYG